MAAPNYRNQLARIVPRVLRGPRGSRLVATIAYLFEEIQESLRQAVRASWIGDQALGPAYDGLAPGGNEVSLPRYPNETWTQYHARLQRAWSDWPFAGDEDTLQAQLAAAGWPGVDIYDPRHWPGRPPSPYWSQFWLFFPFGTHPVTGTSTVGAFTVGDGTVVGLAGITRTELYTIRAIVAKFKPGDWICRGLIFELSGWTVGTGHEVGEPGLVIGGSVIEAAAA